MSRIAIYLDNYETTKPAAAEALNEVNGPAVKIYELENDNDRVITYVDVFPRRRAFGEVQPPQVNWSALGSVSAEQTRQYAQMMLIAAQLIERADQLAQ